MSGVFGIGTAQGRRRWFPGIEPLNLLSPHTRICSKVPVRKIVWTFAGFWLCGLLAAVGVNIDMISTSEIKISVVIDLAKGEPAVKAVHAAFIGWFF